MRELHIGIASEWVGERVGGLERQSADLIRSVIAEDRVNRYVVFVTARGARSLGPLGGPRTMATCPFARGRGMQAVWRRCSYGVCSTATATRGAGLRTPRGPLRRARPTPPVR